MGSDTGRSLNQLKDLVWESLPVNKKTIILPIEPLDLIKGVNRVADVVWIWNWICQSGCTYSVSIARVYEEGLVLAYITSGWEEICFWGFA